LVCFISGLGTKRPDTLDTDSLIGGLIEGNETRQIQSTLFFLIRTSNCGAEAQLSYIFLLFEAEKVLKMFLNLHDFDGVEVILEQL